LSGVDTAHEKQHNDRYERDKTFHSYFLSFGLMTKNNTESSTLSCITIAVKYEKRQKKTAPNEGGGK